MLPATSLDLLLGHTARFVTTARDVPDLTVPSLCAGWSRAHVVAHVARNAEGLARAVRGLLRGVPTPVYAGDKERDADIERTARLPKAALIDDLTRTGEDVLDAFRGLRPDHADRRIQRTPGGMTFRVAHLVTMRLREVVYHHVDLLAGFSFTDVEGELLTAFLADEVSRTDDPHRTRAELVLQLARGVREEART